MIRVAALAVIVIAVAAASAAGQPLRARAPSHIIFVSERDGDSEIYAVNADGSRFSQLTRNRAPDEGVTVAPSGRRLAFSCNGALCLLEPEAGRMRRVRAGADFYGFAAWSPDSRKVAYAAHGSVFVVNAAGGAPARVVRGDDLDVVDWSADSRVLLVRRRFFQPEPYDDRLILSAFPISGGPPIEFDGADPYVADWSPRRNEVAVVQKAYDGLDVVQIVDAETGSRRDVLRERDVDVVAWSPNARWLAVRGSGTEFMSPTRLQVFEIRPTVRVVVSRANSGYSGPISWSPDSRSLTATRNYGRRVDIIRVPSGAVRVLGARFFEEAAEWSPDATEIAFGGGGKLPLSAASVNGSRVRRVIPTFGSVVAWVRGGVPASAHPATRLPASQIATPSEVRTRGWVTEISAAGRRVAAIVAADLLDTTRVVAWNAGARVVARSAPRYPCCEPKNITSLLMRGGRVNWATAWRCSPELCERTLWFAALRGPRRMVVRRQYQYEDDEPAPHLPWPVEPRPERHQPQKLRGLRMYVEGRTIHVGRQVISPPGRGRVDAWLTPSGLFYSFNVWGDWPGRIRFVPMRELR